jgi:hypothetical protein
MVADDPRALLLTEMLPELLPADAGVNCATSAALAPALIV